MSKGAYTKSARWYDLVIEPLVKTLRTTGLTLFPPAAGMSVLDIGCGTGTHLGIYRQAGCNVYGIDLSPAMLKVAQAKLAGQAGLGQGDGSRMPIADESFDLITAMFALHAMPASPRRQIISEAKRVMRKDGRFLVIDYHPGPVCFPEGWLYKGVIASIEFLASGEHYANYRGFMSNGGLVPLLAGSGLVIDSQKIVGGGTIGLYLLHPSDPLAPCLSRTL
ncbi:MAG: class I SAM-dependent methyltransferase [Anaerolineae bacterium]|jgi:ubiquinone/menaquinone biosynthesis C-methylase UbiE